MTVKDLIELNTMITDLVITVRIGGNLLLDQLNIGCSEGVKPPYPTRVPKDYYEIKLSRIPAKWLDLEVISWTVGRASSIGVNPRRYNNSSFHGERLQITALPSGESLEIKEKTKDTDKELPGQMNIIDFLGV